MHGDPEAMQWNRAGWPVGGDTVREMAEEIIAWVRRNDGQAWLVPNPTPRIAVRAADGWIYAEPGGYVVMGTEMFTVRLGPEFWISDYELREFRVLDAEAYEAEQADEAAS